MTASSENGSGPTTSGMSRRSELRSVDLAAAASALHDRRHLAHDVPGRRELLAQAVVGRMRDGGVREVRAPVAVMPGGADRERLAPEALLEQLLDVEGGRARAAAGRARCGAQRDRNRWPRRPGSSAQNASSSRPAPAQQPAEQRPRPGRLAHARAVRVGDEREDVLPERAAAVGAGRAGPGAAVPSRRVPSARRGPVRGPARRPGRSPLPAAHGRPPPSKDRRAPDSQSAAGAAMTRRVCPPLRGWPGRPRRRRAADAGVLVGGDESARPPPRTRGWRRWDTPARRRRSAGTWRPGRPRPRRVATRNRTRPGWAAGERRRYMPGRTSRKRLR